MPVAPSLTTGLTLIPRQVAGYAKYAHITWKGITYKLLVNSASWGDNGNPKFTEYALTPSSGPKQKALHSRGISEIEWSIDADLSVESYGLIALLDPKSRGLLLDEVVLQQGSIVYKFVNCYWSSFTLSASPNAIVTISISGNAIIKPTEDSILATTVLHHGIPSWATGASLITTFSLTHNVPLTPGWANTENSLPIYYRPGSSEYTIDVTTAVELREHTILALGLGSFNLLEAVVTSRKYDSGGVNEHFS